MEHIPATSKNAGSPRIVFMGTPEFAVASLEALVKAKFNIVGVVTAPDKPAGRGLKIQECAVKKYAVRHKLNVLQPEKLKDPVFIQTLSDLQADIQVVVAFRMLPEIVWNMPPMGTINLHGSLLPQYRGAAPINWAVINGETHTGVTTFKLQHEIDTGNILLQEVIPIGEDETAGELHDRMKVIGAQLLVETIKGLANGTLSETPQSDVLNKGLPVMDEEGDQSLDIITRQEIGNMPLMLPLKHAPKIFTETAMIDWKKGIDEIHNLIRGLSPYPGAFTELGDKTLKIFRSRKEFSVPTSKNGRWESDGKTWLKYACSNGYIYCLEIQLEGKKKMQIDEFLRGYRFQ